MSKSEILDELEVIDCRLGDDDIDYEVRAKDAKIAIKSILNQNKSE